MSTPLVDTHLHMWNLDRSAYNWLREIPAIDHTHQVKDALPALDRLGVTAAVLVQSDDTDSDTDAMLEAASEYEIIRGVVGYAPLHDPRRADARLDQIGQELVGVRNLVHTLPDEWMRAPAFIEGVGLLAARGLAFELVCGSPAQLTEAISLADRYPDLTIVLDHLARPPIGTATQEPWWSSVADAARRPNMFAKISGLYPTVGQSSEWTKSGILPYVEHALEVFGPERCMFGGDWPIVELSGGYDRAARALVELIDDLAPDERAAVRSATASRVYLLEQCTQTSYV